MTNNSIEQNLAKLTEVGLSLSAEPNTALLLEKILLTAKDIANADGGTLYILKNETELHMEIVRNDSLNIAIGGSCDEQSSLPSIPLYLASNEPNLSNVVSCALHNDEIIDITNRHNDQRFDFSGAEKFDKSTGYNSTSFLTIPMKDHKGKMIGALQLINSIDDQGNIKAFNNSEALLVKSLASQAAIALTNNNLIDELEQLFESFIELIAAAIDEKSPYTGGHCRRVPELTIMLTEAIADLGTGPMKDFSLSDNDRYELKIAAWLHDCGKIVTPVHVVDKATKLETIHDRVDDVNNRFEIIRRDFKIKALEHQLTNPTQPMIDYQQLLLQTEEDQAFINKHNTGSEFMSDEDQQRVATIASRYKITNHAGETVNLLSDEEVMNLQISRGTLNNDERQIINKHINVTIDMLNNLKLPEHLKNVPEIAGGHHERMDGKGYPNGLTREQMSIPARVMGIADIFEALTAADRPYKQAKPISEALSIMKRMKDTGHIDPDIFDVFVRERIYLDYANRFLLDSQIDEIDVTALAN